METEEEEEQEEMEEETVISTDGTQGFLDFLYTCMSIVRSVCKEGNIRDERRSLCACVCVRERDCQWGNVTGSGDHI